MKIVELENVSMTYKNGIVATKDISLSIKKGEIIGLLGPNGAGKSTLIKIITGILMPSSGKVEVLGNKPNISDNNFLSKISCMFGSKSSLWIDLPAIESLYLIKDIYKIPKNEFTDKLNKYTKILKIGDYIYNRPVKNLSLGQKMKVELLLSILHSPEILILDEPTLGFDIQAKNAFREIVFNLVKNTNISVLIATHDLVDVEKLCSRIILINKGEKLIDQSQESYLSVLKSSFAFTTSEKVHLENIESKLISKSESSYRYLVNNEDREAVISYLDRKNVFYYLQNTSLEDILYDYYN